MKNLDIEVLDLKLNSGVSRGSLQDACRCIKESFAVLGAANRMVESLRNWDETSNISQDVWANMQLINAETLLAVLDAPAIDAYHDYSLSRTPALFDRLTVFQVLRDQLVVILTEIVDAYQDMTDEEQVAVLELSKKILEQLSFFLFYEFNFDETSFCVQKQERLKVNAAVREYIGKEGLDLEERVLFMLSLYVQYRPTIPSFDFSDEEIDMFYYHVGVLAHDLLDNIDELNPELVRQLARGEIAPEDVVASLLAEPTQPTSVNKLNKFN